VKPTVVPFITSREAEIHSTARLVVRPEGRGIGYHDEGDQDRDERGVLWGRVTQALASPPVWRNVHPARQRVCMERLLCQICADPADRTGAGWLFLQGGKGGEGVLTAQPPLCLQHALVAALQCPYLNGQLQAMRVQAPLLYGVLGTGYILDRHSELLQLPPDPPVPYSHPRVGWVLASQLVRCLTGVTVIDLEQEVDRILAGVSE